uniref:Uncharacterized protein n=1 Tax=Caenorhabditis japonica TaxID=281687 RepID=A0A8R1IUE4_CAEJA
MKISRLKMCKNEDGRKGALERQNTYYFLASGLGLASGANTNVTGNGFVNIDGDALNGNSSMTAYGGGDGSSAADTKAVLDLEEDGVRSDESISGSVNAVGDNTNVRSTSLSNKEDGFETLTNMQHVKSSGSRASSVSASSTAILKRKKRFAILLRIFKQ